MANTYVLNFNQTSTGKLNSLCIALSCLDSREYRYAVNGESHPYASVNSENFAHHNMLLYSAK